MKENRSLYLSLELKEKMNQNLSGIFNNYFPYSELENLKAPNTRDRVFSPETTLLTMIVSMTQSDKSLQNSVNIYQKLHDEQIEELLLKENEHNKAESKKKPGPGRPKTHFLNVQKSKTKPISDNTSAYAQARKRLDIELLNTVFRASSRYDNSENPYEFYGRKVFITDGTYLQMQDTEAIRDKFQQSQQGAYPRGLLQVLIEQGTGFVKDFTLESDARSELELIIGMLDSIEAGSLLLADDLYNCFILFYLLKQRQVDIIVPGKRPRNYTVIETIAPGDQIVRLKNNSKSTVLGKKYKVEEKYIDMRRLEVKNPEDQDKTFVFYTSLLDKKISKEEILLKYWNRWDIEVNIREIKSVMEMDVIRSKSYEMALKELISGLIAYNFIRRLINESAQQSAFPPEADIIQKFYALDSSVLMDKTGRVYNRWSPGRSKKIETTNC